jgi:hypothetical protein
MTGAMTFQFEKKPFDDANVTFRPRNRKPLPDISAWVAFYPESSWDVPHLPLVTSLHVIGGKATGFCYSTPVAVPIPVSDAWLGAVGHSSGRAQVLLVLEPMAVPHFGLDQGLFDAFLTNILSGEMNVAMREVPVTVAPEVPDLGGIDPVGSHGPKEWERWSTWSVAPEPASDEGSPPTS